MKEKKIIEFIIYFGLVFTSNFAITVMQKTVNEDKMMAFVGNLLYEFCNVGSLYLGIKNLPFLKMIILHLTASALGYMFGQLVVGYMLAI